MPRPANRFDWDYSRQAEELGPPPLPDGAPGIIDAHSHIHGPAACRIYDRVRRLFGVGLTYTMTQLPGAEAVREVLGDSVRFVAIPTWSHPDKAAAHRWQYLRDIEVFHHRYGARMMKLWASPALRQFVPDGATDLADIDSRWRREHCRLAVSLGMMIMVHVADPDTWFAHKWNDPGRFGTKAHQYVGLERMLDEFPVPWIAAHMGGWPERLDLLDGLLARHPNLHLDTSATRWMVRELSRHRREDLTAFFQRHRGRILFGTDVVTLDDHLVPHSSGAGRTADLSRSPEEAFELYASRHWALRALFETTYSGESPIEDPDLLPGRTAPPDDGRPSPAPTLRGMGLPRPVLQDLYYNAADRLLGRWWAEHP